MSDSEEENFWATQAALNKKPTTLLDWFLDGVEERDHPFVKQFYENYFVGEKDSLPAQTAIYYALTAKRLGLEAKRIREDLNKGNATLILDDTQMEKLADMVIEKIPQGKELAAISNTLKEGIKNLPEATTKSNGILSFIVGGIIVLLLGALVFYSLYSKGVITIN